MEKIVTILHYSEYNIEKTLESTDKIRHTDLIVQINLEGKPNKLFRSSNITIKICIQTKWPVNLLGSLF